MPSPTFFADDPVDGTDAAPDRLGRMTYAKNVAALLDRISQQSESSVIALIAPWGGGKSSVLEMTIKRVREMTRWRVAEFNPWLFVDLDTMLLGFFAEVTSALPKEVRPSDIRKDIGKFVTLISPLGKLGSIVGVDAESSLKKLGNWVAGESSATAERNKLIERLRTAQQPVLLVLDDLDRLAPTELLLVFKLVRLVGRLPNMYYLLSYDERTLIDVLTLTELCGNDEKRARDYLEKIVQVRLDLPPLLQKQAAELLWRGIDDLAGNLGVGVADEGRQRFERAYVAYLREHLETPRAINRYLAQVGALHTVLDEEVDFFDFALLTFIRTFEPALYAIMYRTRAMLSVTTVALPSRAGENQGLIYWLDLMRLAKVPEERTEGLIAVLAELFVPMAIASAKGPYTAPDLHSLAERKAIGHRDYFDRYFTFGIPDDDLSDAQVGRTLAKLTMTSSDNPEREQLVLHLITDTARTVRKISMRRTRNLRASEAILRLFAQHFADLTDDAPDGLSQRLIVERLSATILADNQSNIREIMTGLEFTLGSTLFSTRLLASSSVHADVTTVTENSQRVARVCGEYTGQQFTDVPTDVQNLVFVWQMVDAEACRSWLRAQVEAYRWDALDIAGWTITTKTQDGVTTLSEFQEVRVDRLLGLDYLLNRFADRLGTPHVIAREFADTVEDRRAAALYSLGLIRDRAPVATDNPASA
jgi:hypothetical protein